MRIEFDEALRIAMLFFRCDLDEDIGTFLREKAVHFQNKKWCNVYLLLNKEELILGHLKVETHFTLSYKSMPTGSLSKSKVKKYGYFKDDLTLNFVLIGQLGKWIVVDETGRKLSSEVSGEEILEQAFR